MKKRTLGSLRVFLKLFGLVLAITVSTAAQQAAGTGDSPGTNGTESSDKDCGQRAVHAPRSSEPVEGESRCAQAEDQAQQERATSNAPALEQKEHPGSPQAGAQDAEPSSAKPEQNVPPVNQQPKRILGVMPNFRAVTAGTLPPPPTAKESFVLATQNSFDYSSFIFVSFTSALAEWTYTHPQLGQGMTGYGRYYWRGLLDKTDGNYLVLFALPTVFHQDERYFTRGKGGFWRRFAYAGSRVFVTPNYQGHDSFNYSELLGRGMAQGLSVLYYPSQTRTFGAIGSKYGYAILRDALTNIFREFWPDIDSHVLHRHPKGETH